MRDHDDGRATAMDVLDQLHHSASHLRVQIAGRFVSEQQPRLSDQSTRDGDALLLAARQLRRIVWGPRGQPYPFEHGIDAPATLGGRHASITQRHVDVVVDVEIGNEIEGLEDEPELLVPQLGALSVAEAACIDPVEPILASAELFQQAGDREKRGFAGAGGTHDGHELAFLDFEAQIAEGVRLDHFGAVYLRQARHLQHTNLDPPMND